MRDGWKFGQQCSCCAWCQPKQEPRLSSRGMKHFVVRAARNGRNKCQNIPLRAADVEVDDLKLYTRARRLHRWRWQDEHSDKYGWGVSCIAIAGTNLASKSAGSRQRRQVSVAGQDSESPLATRSIINPPRRLLSNTLASGPGVVGLSAAVKYCHLNESNLL